MKDGPWVGGNHLVNEQHSADTQSVQINADGKPLSTSKTPVDCNRVTIDVVNHLYDPSSKVENGKFSKVLLTETVHYVVMRNAIDVTVNHTFADDASGMVSIYYGMQSMFYLEDKVMTPHGAYNDFTPIGQLSSFKLGDYRNFDRFVEMNSSLGWCQATHLLPEGIGDHRYVSTYHDIFITSTYGKHYHVLIRNLKVTGGTSYTWRGVYSWFRPLVNNADVLVYSAVKDGEEVIYVDAKRACNVTFSLPERWCGNGKKVSVAQADNGMVLNTDNARNVRLTASRAGTALLK